MGHARTFSIAAAIGAGSAGSAAGAAYKLLVEQSKSARTVIGPPSSLPPKADGVYPPSGGAPAAHGDGTELTLLMVGDSTAAGLGCELAEELPGVLLARGLAEETDRAVHLLTHAVVGANSRALADQVELALKDPALKDPALKDPALKDPALKDPALGTRPPDAVVIIIGANDVTGKLSPRTSAQLLGAAVTRLRELGCVVVVATCPDLGAIRPIPQPLRSVVRSWSLRLAQAQREAVLAAGGHPVAVADLLSPEFLTRPEALFSPDQFHPSAAGYEAATSLLLPALCFELGVWGGGPLAEPPRRSAAAEARRPTVRATAALNRGLAHRARAGGRAVGAGGGAAVRLLRLGSHRNEP